jgi:hypothetical protein
MAFLCKQNANKKPAHQTWRRLAGSSHPIVAKLFGSSSRDSRAATTRRRTKNRAFATIHQGNTTGRAYLGQGTKAALEAASMYPRKTPKRPTTVEK